MHIVQALANLSVGGSELVVAELTEHLAARGHHVTVLGARGPLSERVEAAGADPLEWPIGRKRPATLKLVARLRDWLSRNHADLLHVHSRLPAWICHLAVRRMPPERRPIFVTSMHGQYTVSPYSAVMARGDRVIAVSDHIRRFTLENYDFVDPDRVVTIHGGIDREAFPFGHRAGERWYQSVHTEFPELAGKRILLLPGRLSRYKGHATFLELLSRLAPLHPDVHGVIVGQARPGSRYRAELEGLASRGSVLDRLTFVGLREDMRDWMAASEIVYNLCSDPPEAFGRVIPEALHLGVPVIAWDHGGASETLEVMFPQGAVRPGNRRELLERTLGFLDRAPAVPESEAFRLEASMEKTMALYRSAMENKA